jgi:predicted secreted protein
MNRTHRTVLGVVAGLALVPAAPAGAATVTVGAKDTNKTVALGKGDRLRVVLSENGSTGYVWRTTRRPAASILRFVSSTFVAPPQTDPPTAGAPGKRVFVYRARAKGSTALGLSLVGPSGDVGERFRLSIRVR